MIENPLTILAYTSAWSGGYLFLKTIRFAGHSAEKISALLPAGLFLQSWITFLLGILGVPLTRIFFVAVDIFITASALLLLAFWSFPRKRYPQPLTRTLQTGKFETWFIRISAIALAVYFLMHAAINAERVVSFSDAVMSYDFRAHAIAYEGKIRTSVYDWPEVETPNFMYPPLTTLFHAHYYALGGKNPKLIYSLLLIAASGITAAGIWRHTKNRIASLLGACFLAFLPVVRKFSLLESLDFPALVFATLGVVYLTVYLEERRRPLLILSALGFSGVGFLRPEDPLFFVGILSAIFLHFKRKKECLYVVLTLVFLYTAVYGSHEYFIRAMVGHTAETHIGFDPRTTLSLWKFKETCWAFIRHFSSDRFMLLGPVVLFLWLFGGKDTSGGKLLIKLILAFSASWIILLLIDQAGDWKEMRLEWSYFRIFIRIAPLLILYVLRHPVVIHGLNEIFRNIRPASVHMAKAKL